MTVTRRDCLTAAATAPALAGAGATAADASPNATETAWRAYCAAEAMLCETDRKEMEIRRQFEREGTVLPDEPCYPSPFGHGFFYSLSEFDKHVADDYVMRGHFGEDCRRAREAQMARERASLIRSLEDQRKLLESVGIAELQRQHLEASRALSAAEAAILETPGRTPEDARRKLVVLLESVVEDVVRDELSAVIAQLGAGRHEGH